MSRRKDNSPAISFFSFQDIITSVTGIMFLVVLILILMLLMRKDYTPEEREESIRLTQFEEELKRLQQQLEASVRSSADVTARMQALQSLNIKEIPVQKQKVGQELVEIGNKKRLLAEEELRKGQQLVELQRQKAGLLEKLKDVQARQTKVDADEARLKAENGQLASKLQAVNRTIRFTWQKASSKKALLVECGGQSLAVGEAGGGVPLVVFHGSSDAIVKKFVKWLNKYDRSRYYVLLLVKPGAFEYAEPLSQHLQELGYERGREVLPEDEMQVFQEEEK